MYVCFIIIACPRTFPFHDLCYISLSTCSLEMNLSIKSVHLIISRSRGSIRKSTMYQCPSLDLPVLRASPRSYGCLAVFDQSKPPRVLTDNERSQMSSASWLLRWNAIEHSISHFPSIPIDQSHIRNNCGASTRPSSISTLRRNYRRHETFNGRQLIWQCWVQCLLNKRLNRFPKCRSLQESYTP